MDPASSAPNSECQGEAPASLRSARPASARTTETARALSRDLLRRCPCDAGTQRRPPGHSGVLVACCGRHRALWALRRGPSLRLQRTIITPMCSAKMVAHAEQWRIQSSRSPGMACHHLERSPENLHLATLRGGLALHAPCRSGSLAPDAPRAPCQGGRGQSGHGGRIGRGGWSGCRGWIDCQRGRGHGVDAAVSAPIGSAQASTNVSAKCASSF